jgi:hypothetical protein
MGVERLIWFLQSKEPVCYKKNNQTLFNRFGYFRKKLKWDNLDL